VQLRLLSGAEDASDKLREATRRRPDYIDVL